MYRSQSQLYAAFEVLKEGVMIFSPQGDLNYINSAATKIFDDDISLVATRDLNRIAAKYEFRLPHGSSLPVEDWPISRIINGQSQQLVELMTRNTDSGRTWRLQFSGEPVRGKNGKPLYGVVIIRDVTEKRKAQEELKRVEQDYRTLANSMPQLVWTALPDGQIDYHNKRIEVYISAQKKPNGDWTWMEMLHPDDLQRTLSIWETAVAQRTTYLAEHRIHMTDGSYRWHLSRAEPVLDEQGEVIKWYGTSTDVHEQRLAHQALRESEKKYRLLAERFEFERNRFAAVMNQMPAVVLVAASTGQLIFVNDRLKTMFQSSSLAANISEYESWKGYGTDGSIYEMDEWPLSRSVFKGEVVTDEDIELTLSSGRRIIVRSNSAPIYGDSGQILGAAAVLQDITEITEAIRGRDEFLSIASHELNTPLTSLKLQSQLVLRSLEKELSLEQLKDRMRTFALQTDQQVKRFARLVDDMLDVSRLRRGQLRMEFAPFDLMQAIADVIDRLRHDFTKAGYNVPDTDNCVSVTGCWDRMRIEQVISNLLTNAIRYGNRKPIQVRSEIIENRVRLIVADNGIGISPQAQRFIFDRFKRGEAKNMIEGLGLGLYISERIVQGHQGRIWVESETGKGSVFYVELPLSNEKA